MTIDPGFPYLANSIEANNAGPKAVGPFSCKFANFSIICYACSLIGLVSIY